MMEQTPDLKSPGAKKINVTLASDVGNWKNTVNEQLAIELAKNPQLEVTGFVPGHTEEQRKCASCLNIELVDAADLDGFEAAELLSHPPDSLQIDILLMHSYGPGLGKQAQVIKMNKKCKWVQIVHQISEEIVNFLENPEKYKDEHKLKVALCEKADAIIAVGPKVAEAYRRALRCSKNDEKLIELTPGIIEELNDIRRVYRDDHCDKFYVLISGSSQFFRVKGCDIAATAIKLLDTSYHLIVVLRSCDSAEKVGEINQALLEQGVNSRQVSIRVCESHLDWHRWLCEVDLVIKPSRTEGFGMSGVLAISAKLPVLVSAYCGLGVVLRRLPTGAKCVMESDDPQVWADKIREIRRTDPHSRHLQAEKLREEYAKLFSWKEQCDKLVNTSLKMTQCSHDDTQSAAQCVWHDESVEDTERKVGNIDLEGKDSTSQTRSKESFDLVDARVKPDEKQVSKRLSMKVTEIPFKVYSDMCVKLNLERHLRFDDFRMLAQKVGLNRDEMDFIKQTFPNHTDEVLKTWSKKREATVGKLIDLLKEDDFDREDVVQILQDWVMKGD